MGVGVWVLCRRRRLWERGAAMMPRRGRPSGSLQRQTLWRWCGPLGTMGLPRCIDHWPLLLLLFFLLCVCVCPCVHVARPHELCACCTTERRPANPCFSFTPFSADARGLTRFVKRAVLCFVCAACSSRVNRVCVCVCSLSWLLPVCYVNRVCVCVCVCVCVRFLGCCPFVT